MENNNIYITGKEFYLHTAEIFTLIFLTLFAQSNVSRYVLFFLMAVLAPYHSYKYLQEKRKYNKSQQIEK